jgi:ApbE superfamily uncharacterized protein (UPF0280 family)
MFKNRTYRNLLSSENLVAFRVTVKETDLFVHAAKPLEQITKELILRHRGYIESFIHRCPEFLYALEPLDIPGPAPIIIGSMLAAGKKAGVGPMAAVAGAIAEHVGIDLLSHTDEVVVENGGDIYLKTNKPVTVGIFAGASPLSLKVGLRIDSNRNPFAVCTSSGTVGHSLSFGKADAVCVVSDSCALADAAATSIGNRITSKGDIQPAIDFGRTIDGVAGLIVIMDEEIGAWGDLEVVPLRLNSS